MLNTLAIGIQQCPVCGASIERRALQPGEELRCHRCGSTVQRASREHLLPLCWALATTGLILVVLANCTPILTFEVAGRAETSWIGSGMEGLVRQGYWPVALMVFFSAMAAPAGYLAGVWYVAGSLSGSYRWPATWRVAKFVRGIAPWSLTPVFAVACMVAVVKLGMLGQVIWHQGIAWLSGLAICSFALERLFDAEEIARGPGQ